MDGKDLDLAVELMIKLLREKVTSIMPGAEDDLRLDSGMQRWYDIVTRAVKTSEHALGEALTTRLRKKFLDEKQSVRQHRKPGNPGKEVFVKTMTTPETEMYWSTAANGMQEIAVDARSGYHEWLTLFTKMQGGGWTFRNDLHRFQDVYPNYSVEVLATEIRDMLVRKDQNRTEDTFLRAPFWEDRTLFGPINW